MDVGLTTSNNGKFIFDDGKSSIDKSENSDYSDTDDEVFIIENIIKKNQTMSFIWIVLCLAQSIMDATKA